MHLVNRYLIITVPVLMELYNGHGILNRERGSIKETEKDWWCEVEGNTGELL